jgi:hypothetical protein
VSLLKNKILSDTIKEVNENESERSEKNDRVPECEVYPGLSLSDELNEKGSVQHISLDGDVISDSVEDGAENGSKVRIADEEG